MPYKDKRKARESARRNYVPEKRRNRHLVKSFGIDSAEYQSILEFQNFRCAICKKDNDGELLHVDHNHETGATRGLLCYRCNSAIGHIKEDVALMRSAIVYMNKRG